MQAKIRAIKTGLVRATVSHSSQRPHGHHPRLKSQRDWVTPLPRSLVLAYFER